MQASEVRDVCKKYLQEIFSRNSGKKYFQEIFAINICKEQFVKNICKSYLQASEERDVSGHKGKPAEEKTATFGTTSQISPHIESDPKHETPLLWDQLLS